MAKANKQYLVGTSGWNYKHWKKRFYPEHITKKEWFRFYSQNFSTVEVNYSFYRWPSKNTMKNWYKMSPPGFKFTMKAPRMITHIKKLKNAEKWVKDFYALTKILKEKMGCHLFQLPPNIGFKENNFAKLEQFLKVLDKRKDNVIEFRHDSWWRKEVYELLKEHKTIFCVVSGLGMPKDIASTHKTAYFRFHGKHYTEKYTKGQIENYAKIMKRAKNDKIYAYFNNDFNAYAVKNALQLKGMLNA